MAKFHLPTIEEEQLKKWDDRAVLKQILARNKEGDRKSFVFFEGPPTANGKPGIHHMMGRAYKDVMIRFRTMQGYRVDRKAGWDTHGLPVELEVEKQLGFTKKQDIEQYGIAAFNAKCRESVWKYLDLWQKSTRRIAFWVDMDDPYITYKNDFVESLWWIMKEVDKKSLLYKGYRVTPHCPRCVTSLSSHELAQGYKDTEDPSVFVKFAIAGATKKYFLVWTTTPWTLPANVALAVGPNVVYVEAKIKSTNEVFVLAKERLSVLDDEYEILREVSGKQLETESSPNGGDVEYVPLYQSCPSFGQPHYEEQLEKYQTTAYRVYSADFVSTADGTGIVHIAPAYGEDDAKLGKERDLPTPFSVDSTGLMILDVPGKGKFFKKADADIMADLKGRKEVSLLYKSGTYVHSYPFCWRCGTPILYYAKSSWYIRMSDLREKLISNNEQVNWVPSHIKEGRFGEWLRDVKDWAISRERYWGTPLPVWQCASCDKKRVVGSMKELEDSGFAANTYFLQRHGEAENNVVDVISSWPEQGAFPLTVGGREQALASAKMLKAKGVQRIFASDLLRTKETAELIAKECGLEVVFDERLRELNVGKYNGKTEKEFHAEFADNANRFTDAPEGGESLNDVRRRVISFMKDLREKYHGEKIVIVSHGDPLWMMQTVCKDLSDAEVMTWPHYNHTGQFIEMEAPKNLPFDELGNLDVHRPFIDEVALKCECGGAMRRVTDVMDVWFDSGAMPYAQWHYPFENAERIDVGTNFPADFICEAIDQTRGWFYTLLAVSTLLGKDTPPYKNVICHGHVLDAKGQKMSKSKGNVVDPFAAIEKYGADVIRWYFFTVNQPGDSKRFDEKAVDEVTKKVFLILWNVLTFYKMYAGEKPRAVTEVPTSPTSELNRWILARAAQLRLDVTGKMETYDVLIAARRIAAFIEDLSTWYVRRSRDAFKSGTAKEKDEAVATLGYVLQILSKLMAPFTPFLAEALYAELGGTEDSIHLAAWPEAMVGKTKDIVKTLDGMALVREAASIGLEKRAAAVIPVRQALAKATVAFPEKGQQWMSDILKEELNVLDVEWVKGEKLEVTLDTVVTPELRRMGAAREMVRTVNGMRKNNGLTIADRIVLTHSTDSDFWHQTLKEHGDGLLRDVKADAIEAGRSEGDVELDADGQKIWVGFRKV